MVVIPCGITAHLPLEKKTELYERCEDVVRRLTDEGFRAETDLRDNYSPGWKYNHWELKVRLCGLRQCNVVLNKTDAIIRVCRFGLSWVHETWPVASLSPCAETPERSCRCPMHRWSTTSLEFWTRSTSTCSTSPLRFASSVLAAFHFSLLSFVR